MRRDKNRPRNWIVRATPIIALLGLCSLALVFVYSNSIYQMLGRTTRYVAKANVGTFEIALSAQRVFEMPDHSKPILRDIRISYPLDSQSGGCELTYGGAIYTYPESSIIRPARGQFAFTNPRYLIKFKYDLKNKRCESKDLFVLTNDVPQKIVVQLIKLELTDSELREAPQPEGIEISLSASSPSNLEIRAIATKVDATTPFISASTSVRNKMFSLPKVRDFSLLIHPYDSLNDFIFDEANRRLQKCKMTGVCDRILAAVAKITDRRLLKLFEEARQAGMPIELISNFRYRVDMEADDLGNPAELFQYSPWMWLRGSPYSKFGVGHLPMHTKFVVFGDDLVVSSNPSLRGGVRNRSREYSIVYRDTAAVKLFAEIFTLVQTSLYYPLNVNLNDDLIILLNADRPRQYAVSIEKPYVAIDTQEGVRTSAYGALYELLARAPGKLSLIMSPVTNSCAPYKTQHCLFDLLNQRAKEKKLDMVLNGYYYLPPSRRSINPIADGLWTTPKFARLLNESPVLNTFRTWFGPGTGQPRILIESLMAMSTHHERLALLGDDISILGSANWANTATVNTIEVIRSPELNARLREDVASFNEPWFVSSRQDIHPSLHRYGDCDFSFEIGGTEYQRRSPFVVSRDAILGEVTAKFPQVRNANFSIIEPKASAEGKIHSIPRSNDDAGSSADDRFSKRSLQDQNEVQSSYMCLEESSTMATYVIRVD